MWKIKIHQTELGHKYFTLVKVERGQIWRALGDKKFFNLDSANKEVYFRNSINKAF